jgi:hypothetical protein
MFVSQERNFIQQFRSENPRIDTNDVTDPVIVDICKAVNIYDFIVSPF